MKKRKPKKSSYISFGRQKRKKDGTTTPLKWRSYQDLHHVLRRVESVAMDSDTGYGADLPRGDRYGEDD